MRSPAPATQICACMETSAMTRLSVCVKGRQWMLSSTSPTRYAQHKVCACRPHIVLAVCALPHMHPFRQSMQPRVIGPTQDHCSPVLILTAQLP